MFTTINITLQYDVLTSLLGKGWIVWHIEGDLVTLALIQW